MKKTFLLLFAGAVLFTGCKDRGANEADSATQDLLEQEHDALSDAESHHNVPDAHDSWLTEIQLNEGVQWIANPETIKGVEEMRKHIHTAELNAVDDYKALAKVLNDDKNYIVEKCTMEGASHDNLHIWLHPLIEQIEALGNVSDTNRGQVLVDDIEDRLTRFYEFFK